MRNCPAKDRLQQAAGDEPDAELAEHLEGCATCREHMRRITEENALVQRLRALDLTLPSDELPPPTDIPGYEIVRAVHRGGQGIVWEATQLHSGERVALKTLLGGARATKRQERRFAREIALVGELRHPNLVPLLDSGTTEDGVRFFAMEFVDGVPLDEYWRLQRLEHGPPPLRAILTQFRAVCDALAYAHERAVVHRDLKPANVLVDTEGRPRVVDFGLARPMERDAGLSTLTRSGEFAGSLAWAAPEQLEGDPTRIDPRTDVFALGLVLYRLLTGVHPHPAPSNLTGLVRELEQFDPAPPSRRIAVDDAARGPREPVPVELDAIVLEALARDKPDRYASAADLSADIDRFLANEPVVARAASRLQRLRRSARRHRTATLAFVGLVVLGAGLSVERVVEAGRRRDEVAREAHQRFDANIRLGREKGERLEVPEAETLLWPEHLDPPAGVERAGRLGDHELSGPLRTHWALWDLFRRSPCRLTISTGEVVSSLALDAGARWLATAGPSGVRVWDAVDGTPRRSPLGRDCRALAFEPEGSRLFLGRDDGVVRLWDASAEQPAGELRGLSNPVVAIELSSDGERLAAGARDGSILVWDVATAEIVASFRTREGPALVVRFRDGRSLLFGNGSERLRLGDLASGIASEAPPALSGAWDAHLEADGPRVGISSRTSISLVDPETGRDRWSDVRAQLPFELAESPSSVVTAERHGHDLLVWALPDPGEPRRLSGHAARVRHLDVGSPGIVASADESGVLKVWDLDPAGHLHELVRYAEPTSIQGFAFDPEERTVATVGAKTGGGSGQGLLTLWDVASGELLVERDDHDQVVAGVSFHPSRPLLASAGYDGIIRLRDSRSGHTEETLTLGGAVHDLAFDPGGNHLAACGIDGRVAVWRTDTFELRWSRQDHGDRVSALTWNRRGDLLVTVDAAGGVRVWNPASGESVASWSRPDVRFHAVDLDPEGRRLAAGGGRGDESIHVIDLETGELLHRLSGHRSPVYALAFHPSGRLLASASENGSLRLWDADTGAELLSIDTESSIFAVEFSRDGLSLAYAGASGIVGVLDLRRYERHIAGNLRHGIEIVRNAGRSPAPARTRAWSEDVLRRR